MEADISKNGLNTALTDIKFQGKYKLISSSLWTLVWGLKREGYFYHSTKLTLSEAFVYLLIKCGLIRTRKNIIVSLEYSLYFIYLYLYYLYFEDLYIFVDTILSNCNTHHIFSC